MTRQSNFTNGDTSNLSGIETFFMTLVNEGKLQQMPMNYDCATLKMYISHLEKENAELKAQLKNHRLMIMADGTIKQFYNAEEVEQIVKGRDELKQRLEKAVELPCKVGDTIYTNLFGNVSKKWKIISIHIAENDISFTADCDGYWRFNIKDYNKTWFTEQRLAELKGGKE